MHPWGGDGLWRRKGDFGGKCDDFKVLRLDSETSLSMKLNFQQLKCSAYA